MINSELEDFFDRLESQSNVAKPAIGGWVVWPALKAHLHKRLLNLPSSNQRHADTQNALANSLEMILRSIGIFMRQYGRLRHLRRTPCILVITENRFVLTKDNKQWHNVFGEFLSGSIEGLTPVIFLSKFDDNQASGNKISAEPMTVFAAVISRLLRRRAEVKDAANALDKEISSFDEGEGAAISASECTAIVASFVAHKFVYKTLLRYLRPQVILGTGLPYRCAEVAAARELNIPVLEVQHGMFSRHSPEYGWHESLGQQKDKMPLPTKYLVYGRQWRDALLKKGFWESKDVLEIGSAVVEYLNSSTPPQADEKKSDIYTITLMTQPTAQELSARAIERILKCIKDQSVDCCLKVKIHPDDRFPYQSLDEVKNCELGGLEFHACDENPIEIILQSDLVVGFTSAALLESAYFSVKTVSLSMGVYPEGLASVFPFEGIERVIPHIGSFDELEQILRNSLEDKDSETLASIKEVPEGIIATGFASNLEREIRLLL